MHHNHLEDLVKHKLLGSTLPASLSVGQERNQRICTANKFPGNAVTRGGGGVGAAHNTTLKTINTMVILNLLCIIILGREMALSLIKLWPSYIFLFGWYVEAWKRGCSRVHRFVACLGWKRLKALLA